MDKVIQKALRKMGRVLLCQNLSLVAAESCTGGGLAYYISKDVQISSLLERGFVVYSEKSKQELLQVKRNTLKKYGAVSKETSEEMVMGALKKSQAKTAVAITGLAGPEGDGTYTRIGTVWISVKSRHKNCLTTKNFFVGSRQRICHQAIVAAAKMLMEYVQSEDKCD